MRERERREMRGERERGERQCRRGIRVLGVLSARSSETCHLPPRGELST